MKRCTLEASVDNILDSIKEDKYNRIQDIKDFIEALELIEGNMFVSLDARWGEGKTFYVRQIEQTLKYLTKKAKSLDVEENLDSAFANSLLGEMELKHTYFPVYYNAWLYDNHNDPLMSLLLIITKICEIYNDTKLSSSVLSEKIAALMNAFSFSFGNFQIRSNFENIKDKFSNQDILSSVKTEEEIREKVKEIFDSIIVENVERLIVFIDELDRCRPSFAIEMLERIKHYFDDDRIVFVFSVNKSQLVHTITRYYGEGFDATVYLNKFFDLNIHLPIINSSRNMLSIYNCEQHHLKNISKDLMAYYKLSFRDSLIYSQYISSLPVNFVFDHESQGCCLSLFIPIITILDIVDQEKKNRFLNGDNSILYKLSTEISSISYLISRFCDHNDSTEFESGYKKIQEVYNFAFEENVDYNKVTLDVGSNFKAVCMRICNGFIKE